MTNNENIITKLANSAILPAPPTTTTPTTTTTPNLRPFIGRQPSVLHSSACEVCLLDTYLDTRWSICVGKGKRRDYVSKRGNIY